MPVIGLLGSGAAPAQSEWTAAFLERLRELGWSEGRNIIIDYLPDGSEPRPLLGLPRRLGPTVPANCRDLNMGMAIAAASLCR